MSRVYKGADKKGADGVQQVISGITAMLEPIAKKQQSYIRKDLQLAISGIYNCRMDGQVESWVPKLEKKYKGLKVITKEVLCGPGSLEKCKQVSHAYPRKTKTCSRH